MVHGITRVRYNLVTKQQKQFLFLQGKIFLVHKNKNIGPFCPQVMSSVALAILTLHNKASQVPVGAPLAEVTDMPVCRYIHTFREKLLVCFWYLKNDLEGTQI